MKNKNTLLSSIVAAMCTALVLLGIAAGTGDGLPIDFKSADVGRTNALTWDRLTLAPLITIGGSNYTGLSGPINNLTNIQFLRGTGVTGTLDVVNGVITAIR